MKHHIEIELNIERVKSKFKAYFDYEKQKKINFKNPFIYAYLTIAIGFVVTLMMDHYGLVIWFGIGVLLSSMILLMYIGKFNISKSTYINYIEQEMSNLKENYYFGFDEAHIFYKNELHDSKIKWDVIQYYEENGQDLYLYQKGRKMFDIISEDVIGEEAFKAFKVILEKNLGKTLRQA